MSWMTGPKSATPWGMTDMKNTQMQRYRIAQDRGFKGSYQKFHSENPLKGKFPERPSKKNDNRATALEKHVIACLESERRVAE